MSSPVEPGTQPSHAPLMNGWSCWRPFVLRGAGLPFTRMLPLAAHQTIQALQAYQEAHHELEGACHALLDAWPQDTSYTSQESPQDTTPGWSLQGTPKQCRSARKLRGYLDKDIIPLETLPALLSHIPDTLQTHTTAIQSALDKAISHRHLLDQSWEQEHPTLCQYLQKEAEESLFLRAMLWQNPQAVRQTIGSLATLPPDKTNRKARQARLLAMGYLQRYCTKNDTIGFFGPVGWGEWSTSTQPLLHPGPQLTESHTISFEPWAMEIFARQWSQDRDTLLDMAPRLHPLLGIHNDRIYGTYGARSRDTSRALTSQEGALLARCDGRTSAREILAALAANAPARTAHDLPQTSHKEPTPDQTPAAAARDLFANHEEAVALFDSLVERGWLLWELSLPWGSSIEESLLAYLRCLPPEAATRYKAQLQPVLDAKKALTHAEDTADAKRLQEAQVQLKEAFVKATGAAAKRHHGQTYAGRTLVYMDSRRALEMQLPETWLSSVSAPLSLLLQSARWFTHSIAASYRTHLRALYEDIARRMRQPEIPLTSLWREAIPWLEPGYPPPIQEAATALQARWQALIAPDIQVQPADPLATRHIAMDVVRLQAQAMATFAAPAPGWPGARHHAPDLMIAADGKEALARGEFQVILGELHTGLNPISTLTMTSQHPSLKTLQALYQQDIPTPGIAPIPHVHFARSAHDSRLALDDFHLDTGAPWASWRPPEQVVAIGELVVRPTPTSLQVVSRDGRHAFDIIQIIERHLKTRAANHFQPFAMPGLAHRPRISLDRLIVARETWRVPIDALLFATKNPPQARFEGAYQWAEQAHLPRFLFVSSPHEVKPIYLDRYSPHSIEMFCNLITQAITIDEATKATTPTTLTISEMLPAPSQLWLPDAEEQRYTCEIRTIAVDPIPWTPPA